MTITPHTDAALRALSDAGNEAARILSRAQDPRAAEIRKISARLDALYEQDPRIGDMTPFPDMGAAE